MASDELKLALSNPGLSAALEIWQRDRAAISSAMADFAALQKESNLTQALHALNSVAGEHRRIGKVLADFGLGASTSGIGNALKELADLPSISKLAGELTLGTSYLRTLGEMPRLADIGKALNPTLHDLTTDLRSRDGFSENWQTYLKGFVDFPQTAGIGKTILAASRTASVNFSSVHFEELFTAPPAGRAAYRVLTTTSQYARRNAKYVHSLRAKSVESDLRSLPSEGLSAHSSTLLALTVGERDGQDTTSHESFLLENLHRLDPDLATNYRGMKAAFRNQGTDWWTQAGSSGRKLVEGVIEKVAPDTIVVPWSVENDYQLRSPRQATRRAKITWLCSLVSNADYGSCLRSQLVALLSVMDYLNKAVHTNGDRELARRFGAVLRDVEELVRHLLTIWLIRRG